MTFPLPSFLVSLSLLLFLYPSPLASTFSTTPFDFIRVSCNVTLYPSLCFSSLSPFATSVHHDNAHLALFAIRLSLSNARRASAHFAALSRHADFAGDHRAAAALHDCSSVFSDAVDQMRGSLRQINQLGTPTGSSEESRFQVSNVQTWMSAALTNEDTCTDGFADVADGPVKRDVCGRVEIVKEFTSNALALVNNYAATLG